MLVRVLFLFQKKPAKRARSLKLELQPLLQQLLHHHRVQPHTLLHSLLEETLLQQA
jgi:hypothetical protein